MASLGGDGMLGGGINCDNDMSTNAGMPGTGGNMQCGGSMGLDAGGMSMLPNPGVDLHTHRGEQFANRRGHSFDYYDDPYYRGYGRGYGYGMGRPATSGELEIAGRLLLCGCTMGISELFRLCCCRNFGKYPPPDVDPVTGYPVGMAPPGQPMGQPIGQPAVVPMVQPYAPAQVPEYNGMAYKPHYSVTPQSMVADANQPKYGYSS
eukprot:309107_1